MLYVNTVVLISDNTGGNYALCIGILGKRVKRVPVNTLIAISVKSILINRNLKFRKKTKVIKGSVYRALVVRSRWPLKRAGNGMLIRVNSNAVAILGRWENPMGNRILGPAAYEIRVGKYLRFAMVAEGSF